MLLRFHPYVFDVFRMLAPIHLHGLLKNFRLNSHLIGMQLFMLMK